MSFALAFVAAAAGTALAYPNGAPNARLPTLGWSSWIALGPGAEHAVFDYCDDFSIRAAADAFIEVGLYDAGYRHFHLDDCWAGTERNASGYLVPEADHFPNGMKPVIDYVHSKGLSFGLYTCSGTLTCAGGRQGSFGHWQQDADLFASWGVDWVKQDFCNVPAEYTGNPQPLYTNMSIALNATGRPIAFSMCEWGVAQPWTWGNDIAQSWRIAGDHTGVWSSTKSVIQSSAAVPAAYSGRPYGWNDMDMLETGCYEQCAHANGLQTNMTATEYKTEFSMWAISASPLQITTTITNCSQTPIPAPPTGCTVTLDTQLSHSTCALGSSFGCSANGTMWISDGCRGVFTCNGISTTCDVNGTGTHTCDCGGGNVTCQGWLSDLQKEILLNAEVIAVNQDVTPQGRPVVDGDLTVWARKLSDGSAAVALYNENDAPAAISVDFAALGWKSSTAATARDLWAHADLGRFVGRYPATGSVTVPPHGTHMIRLTPA